MLGLASGAGKHLDITVGLNILPAMKEPFHGVWSSLVTGRSVPDGSNRDSLLTGHPKEDNAIGYFSRKLLSKEKNYSATEKEGLAVVATCKHFLPYLLQRHFTIITDHRALKFLTSKDFSSSRIARWMDSLRDLDFEVRYREGIANGNADGMSRQAWLEDDDESLKEGEVLGSSEDDFSVAE